MARGLAVLWLAQACLTAQAAQEKQPLTVADSIRATRVLYESDYGKAVQISPDGQRYLLVLYTGDIERNGNWVEFFTGPTRSMQSAVKVERAARLFTTDYYIRRFLKTPMWLADSERVAFAWNDGKRPGQVTILNLRTHRLDTVTSATRDVEQFAISGDGSRVVYMIADRFPGFTPRFGTDALPQFSKMLSEGFVIANTDDLYPLLEGYPDVRVQGWYSYQYFLANRGQRSDRRIDIDGYTPFALKPDMSPDGRWAIVVAPPAHISDRWDAYTAANLKRNIAFKREDPNAISDLRQLWLVDTRTSAARPLWDVPYIAPPALAWSADSQHLVIRNTVLPFGEPDFTTPVEAVEFDVATGHFKRLDAAPSGRNTQELEPAVSVELREDENTPPLLTAVDPATGATQTILDWNSRLRTDFTLGRVELISWKDPQGRAWSGRLYYPVDFTPGRRFPLAILTAPRAATQLHQFSLRGAELIACAVSIAQPLANRNIAALVMSQPDDREQARMATPEEGPIVVRGYESAIAHLVQSGLVARDRVGLVGFSRGGFYVQYAITHSQFPFRAANSSDNVNQSYMQYLLAQHPLIRSEFDRVNGAAPYGEGLKAWLERAPGFNADRIRAPLRLERNDGGLRSILGDWELYSHLRNLGKPVEYYVIPDIEHGSHGLVLPKQQLASLDGSTDWMDFWLNDHEDPLPEKREQYARWKKLRILHEQDLKRRDAGS